MDKEMLNKFVKAMGETASLVEYMSGEYDFGVDAFDPVVSDITTLLYEYGGGEAFEAEEYGHTLARAMSRHVTLQHRVRLLDLLDEIKERVPEDKQALVRSTAVALEDVHLHPTVIGFVRLLYQRHLMAVMLRKSDESQTADESLQRAVENIKSKYTRKVAREIAAHGESALMYIEHELDDCDEDEFMNLFKVICSMPCHLSASILSLMIFDIEVDVDVVLRESGQDLRHLIAEHIVNRMQSNPDFLEKWVGYEFLAGVKDHRLLDLLKRELTEVDEYDEDPEDEEALLEFYSDVARMLCDLRDRRAIPAFIEFLSALSEDDLWQEIGAKVEDILEDSPWFDEIRQGLDKLLNGERVLIGKDEQFPDSIPGLVSEAESPPVAAAASVQELESQISHERVGWDSAYHEALDGLRPIDIPDSKVESSLMSQMLDDFQKQIDASQSRMKSDDLQEQLRVFQDDWMLTPLPSRHGALPLTLILKDREKLASSPALQGHFSAYKQKTTATIYLEASEHLRNGELEACRKKLRAVLQIEPDNPLALRLKNKLAAKEREK